MNLRSTDRHRTLDATTAATVCGPVAICLQFTPAVLQRAVNGE